MSPYVLGLVTLPALLVIGAAALCLARLLLGFAAAGIAKVGKDSTDHQRRRVAAVVYGCRRARMVALGDYAVVVVGRTDHERRLFALDALDRRVSLADLKMPPVAKPGRKHTPPTDHAAAPTSERGA